MSVVMNARELEAGLIIGPLNEGAPLMNVWKPLAIVSTSALILVVGQQVATATSGSSQKSSVDGDYRRMRSALDSLRTARDHLMNAEHNHGGWRERAVEGTDRAIHETEEAIKWNP